MSFLHSVFQLYQDVTSLGGTYRMRDLKGKYSRLHEAYDRSCDRLIRYDAELAETKLEIERQVDVVRRRLKTADGMLRRAPGVGLSSVLSPAVAESAHLPGMQDLPFTPKPNISMKTGTPIAAGLSSGVITSAGTWGTAEVLSRSTAQAAGTGLSSLIAKAGLAGYSAGLATTGTVTGTMVASSPLIITGVGAAVAVAVSSKISHSRANKLSRVCHQLEKAQKERASDINRIGAEVQTLDLLEAKLKNQDRVLAKAVSSTRQRLFRFGPFSHLWRVVKVPFTGSYYRPQEIPLLESLNESVLQFVAAFKKRSDYVPPTDSALA